MKESFLAHYADFKDEYYLVMILSVISKLKGGYFAAALQLLDDLEDDAEEEAIFFLKNGDSDTCGKLNSLASALVDTAYRVRGEIRA